MSTGSGASSPPPAAPSAITPTSQAANLLAQFNGEQFSREQLDSLIAQSFPHWTIYASDDGSSDSTIEILSEYQSSLGPSRLKILNGPHEGFAANFIWLLRNENINADYFAFCDQDDIWEPTRLEAGIDWMRSINNNSPALFCSRTSLVDNEGKRIGLSPHFKKTPCFKNALVQSIAGGNTMLLNAASRSLLARTEKPEIVVSTRLVGVHCGHHV